MKHFLRNINLLNILILCAVLLFANYTVLPLFNMSVPLTLPSVKNPPVHKDEQPADIDVPLLADYTMIAEDNLFHPERKVPVDKADNQPLEHPEFVLYGTLITDDIRLAYLKDRKAPLNTEGRGERQIAMKIGDTMSGYSLKEIYPDKVIMARGDDMVSVLVSDSQKRDSKSGASSQGAPKTPPRQFPLSTSTIERASRSQDVQQSPAGTNNLNDRLKNRQWRTSGDDGKKIRTLGLGAYGSRR